MKAKLILFLIILSFVLCSCSGDNPEKTYYSLLNKYGKDNLARVEETVFIVNDNGELWFYKHTPTTKNPYSGRLYSGYKRKIVFGE